MAAKIDRQTTTPFLLKLFYRQGTFHRLDEFSPTAALPPHLQIYTWQTCTLREMAHLLLSALPSLLPNPAIGTRLSFRLIFPDTRPHNLARSSANPNDGPVARYQSKELGSVVIGGKGPGVRRDEEVDMEGDTHANGNGESNNGNNVAALLDDMAGDADKTLQDAKFIIGDYVSVIILPPLADGSVQPPQSDRGPSRAAYVPPRDYGPSRSSRDFGNGFGGGGSGRGWDDGYGRRGGGRFEGRGGAPPMGEWRRGEAPPGDDNRGFRGRGRGRGRGW